MKFSQITRKQAGFTLIELIVVIVILGILAATAIPRFLDTSQAARFGKANAGLGAVKSAAALAHAGWLAAGTSPASITMEGTAVAMDTASGYPTTVGIVAAAGGLTDYTKATAGQVLTVSTDASGAGLTCTFTYTAPTAAGVAPTYGVPVQGNC